MGRRQRAVTAASTRAAGHRSGRAAVAGRLAAMLVLGALLAGCDKCGDWWSPLRGEAQACREQAPPPPQ